MIYTMAAYFDVETQKYNPPMAFPFEKDGVIETIREATIKGKIEGAEAFALCILGTYDTLTGKFTLLKEPDKVLTLTDYVRKGE